MFESVDALHHLMNAILGRNTTNMVGSVLFEPIQHQNVTIVQIPGAPATNRLGVLLTIIPLRAVRLRIHIRLIILLPSSSMPSGSDITTHNLPLRKTALIKRPSNKLLMDQSPETALNCGGRNTKNRLLHNRCSIFFCSPKIVIDLLYCYSYKQCLTITESRLGLLRSMTPLPNMRTYASVSGRKAGEVD